MFISTGSRPAAGFFPSLEPLCQCGILSPAEAISYFHPLCSRIGL